MAVSGKGAEGLDTAARAMAEEARTRVLPEPRTPDSPAAEPSPEEAQRPGVQTV